jgi:hypothetical protein
LSPPGKRSVKVAGSPNSSTCDNSPRDDVSKYNQSCRQPTHRDECRRGAVHGYSRSPHADPSTESTVLRGCCNGIAGRGGFGFRPILGVKKRGTETCSRGCHSEKTWKTGEKPMRNATSVSGVFLEGERAQNPRFEKSKRGKFERDFFRARVKTGFWGARGADGACCCSTGIEIRNSGRDESVKAP